MANAVYKTKNRETGALIELFDAQSPDNNWDASHGRWVIICTVHHAHDAFTKQADAYRAMTAPSGWCDDCASLKSEGRKVNDKVDDDASLPGDISAGPPPKDDPIMQPIAKEVSKEAKN